MELPNSQTIPPATTQVTEAHREALKELLASNYQGEGDENSYLHILAKHFPQQPADEAWVDKLVDDVDALQRISTPMRTKNQIRDIIRKHAPAEPSGFVKREVLENFPQAWQINIYSSMQKAAAEARAELERTPPAEKRESAGEVKGKLILSRDNFEALDTAMRTPGVPVSVANDAYDSGMRHLREAIELLCVTESREVV